MNRPKQLYWIGDRDVNGNPLEFFGTMPGVREAIPARDLDPAETAQLTEAQWEAIDSPAGRRLYRRTKPDAEKRGANSKTANSEPSTSPSGNTAAKSAGA